MIFTAPPKPGSVLASVARAFVAVAFTAFVAWYAVDVAQTLGSTTIEFALWLWVALLGWLVVAVGILGVRLELGEPYHGVRAFERSGRVYRLLRVPEATRFMPNGAYAIRLLRRFRPGYRLISGRESARRWEATTRSKEAGHLIHLILTLPLVGYLLANGALAAVATVAALDVVLDAYPILAQRHNRMRIERILARSGRAGRRESAASGSHTICRSR